MKILRSLELPDVRHLNRHWAALALADFYLQQARDLDQDGPALYPRQQVLLQHAQAHATVAQATAYMRWQDGHPGKHLEVERAEA